MRSEPDHILLPISALKSRSSAVFDALERGTKIYISRHGAVVAAIHPFEAVPGSVASMVVSPAGTGVAALTARSLGRSVPSGLVNDAIVGIPTPVIKDGRLFGMLTPATTPVDTRLAEREFVAARAQAVLDFQTKNPKASDSEVIQFAEAWEPDVSRSSGGDGGEEVSPPGPVEMHTPEDKIAEWKRRWIEMGSDHETEQSAEGYLQAPIRFDHGIPVPDFEPVQVAVWVEPARPFRALREAERLVAAQHLPEARALCFGVLSSPTTSLYPAAFWQLGEVTRYAGYTDEAAAWYCRALVGIYATEDISAADVS